jgi:hypothetical protein
MSQAKTDKPSVATYADHEVITPPHQLRKALSTTPLADGDDPTDDQVARAEQALAKLSGQFSAWMELECDRLDFARKEVNSMGFTRATREALFLAAHDIRGEADTFGYPLLTAPADSLCRLIEHTPDMGRIPLTLVDQHVDAIRAIVRERTRPDAETAAAALTRKLREVTDDFLAHENREPADRLDGIFAPSLAPEDRSF